MCAPDRERSQCFPARVLHVPARELTSPTSIDSALVGANTVSAHGRNQRSQGDNGVGEHMRLKSRAIRRGVTAGTLLLSTAACGSDSPSDTGSKKVELTFWSWVPGIDKVVDTWNTAHPDIHVTVSKQAQGDEEVTKVLTADKAGTPPDLFQAEYQALPTLVSNGAAADIKKYAGPAQSKFAPGVWSTITLGTDAVYAIPQDSGPMMLYYRTDI